MSGIWCFLPLTKVQLASGEWVFMCNLVKGDLLSNGARVVCLVEFGNVAHKSYFTDRDWLGVSRHHPVRPPGSDVWQHPCSSSLHESNETAMGFGTRRALNLLLDSVHSFTSHGGVECITLAHGVQGDKVASHHYFGTGLCLADLKGLPGFKTGHTVLENPVFHHSSETRAVCGITI